MQWPNSSPNTKYFRYLSATKVNRLVKRDFPVSGGGFSVLGTGANLNARPPTLRERLDQALSILRKEDALCDMDSPGSTFIAGCERFVEYLMRDVVIWIAKVETTILLLGGSSRFLNFDNFGGEELSGVVPGSNRSAILNALTTLWRTAKSQTSGKIISDPRQIEFHESLYGSINGTQVVTNAHDEIPYKGVIMLRV